LIKSPESVWDSGANTHPPGFEQWSLCCASTPLNKDITVSGWATKVLGNVATNRPILNASNRRVAGSVFSLVGKTIDGEKESNCIRRSPSLY
jgi:hypothetical protein